MTREQRFRYEMFVRVRDFGTANRDLFPESSNGGQTFAQVTAAVAAIEDHLTGSGRARAEAQRVKAATRAAVTDYMKALASTGRRVATTEAGLSPFKMPAGKSAAAVLGSARFFIEEAKKREEPFVQFGLPPTFISEFQTLVDQLEGAVNLRLNSRSLRSKARVGIENALVDGLEVIRNLDVLVANATRRDPVRYAAWRGARRIEGISRPSSPVKPAVPAAAVTADERPTVGDAVDAGMSSPAADEVVLRKVS